MSLFISILIIILINFTSATDDCPGRPERSWEAKLQRDLSCGYYYPVTDTKKSYQVEVQYKIKHFAFDVEEEKVTLVAWVVMGWVDEMLKWNSSEYSNITTTVMDTYLMWMPDFLHYNALSDNTEDFILTYCLVIHDGSICCIPRVTNEVVCESDMRNWPFDSQKCKFKFGTKKAQDPNVIFNLLKVEVEEDKTSGWLMKDIKYGADKHGSHQIEIEFTLERISEDLEIFIVTPVYVVCLIAGVVTLIDVSNNIRLGLILFNLLCHFNTLQGLEYFLPQHSEDVPSIIYFYKGSMLVNIISLVFTVVMKQFKSNNNSLSPKIKQISDKVLNSPLKYGVVFFEQNKSKSDIEDRNQKDWNNIVSVINSVFSYLTVITYVCLIATLMPRDDLFFYLSTK